LKLAVYDQKKTIYPEKKHTAKAIRVSKKVPPYTDSHSISEEDKIKIYFYDFT